jgi:hypothetical protein
VTQRIVECRRLNPFATGDKLSLFEDSPQAKLAVSGEINRIIAAINVNPDGFAMGRMRDHIFRLLWPSKRIPTSLSRRIRIP